MNVTLLAPYGMNVTFPPSSTSPGGYAAADFAGGVGGAFQVAVGGGVELPGDAGDHDAGFEEEAAFEAEGALVVQQIFPPAADDVLRNVDADYVAGAVAVEVLYVADQRAGDLAVRGFDHLERDLELVALPFLL